ncbi:hypothetical protein ACLQ2R_37040 [Streptosporangium sp. DT93]|uniref:hypothetical protein n=1 Tax=Streptosporangium sp. DT93 TaxID=3393428 RepID=UPI003CE8D9B3
MTGGKSPGPAPGSGARSARWVWQAAGVDSTGVDSADDVNGHGAGTCLEGG